MDWLTDSHCVVFHTSQTNNNSRTWRYCHSNSSRHSNTQTSFFSFYIWYRIKLRIISLTNIEEIHIHIEHRENNPVYTHLIRMFSRWLILKWTHSSLLDMCSLSFYHCYLWQVPSIQLRINYQLRSYPCIIKDHLMNFGESSHGFYLECI